MSKTGRKPIRIPSEVRITQKDKRVVITGHKGSLGVEIPEKVKIGDRDGIMMVSGEAGNLQGLVRSLLANAVKGVTEGWSKTLELSGTGYRASATGGELQLLVGYSHPVVLQIPTGIEVVIKDNKITVSGASKDLVGQIAARIREARRADPYKAKGFIYEGEKIVRKAGKTAKGVSATK